MANRLVVALLSLLLISVPVGGTVFQAEPPSKTEQLPSRLTIDGDSRADVDRIYLDFGPALTSTTIQTTAELRRAEFRERLQAVETENDRRTVLRREVDRIDAETTALQQQEMQALQRYAAEEISTQQLLTELALISTTAEELSQSLEVVSEEVAQTPFTTSSEVQLRQTETRLAALTGPVRRDLQSTITGETPGTEVFVQANGTSITVAMIRDRQYIRETTVWNNYGVTNVAERREVVLDQVESIYPWAWSSQQSSSRSLSGFSSGLYQVEVEHEKGEISALYANSTQRVFYERQSLFLSRLNGQNASRIQDSGLIISVRSTYDSGPTRLTVESATGPVPPGQIVVNNRTVASFDSNSPQQWVLIPSDASVRVITENANVSVTSAANT